MPPSGRRRRYTASGRGALPHPSGPHRRRPKLNSPSWNSRAHGPVLSGAPACAPGTPRAVPLIAPPRTDCCPSERARTGSRPSRTAGSRLHGHSSNPGTSPDDGRPRPTLDAQRLELGHGQRARITPDPASFARNGRVNDKRPQSTEAVGPDPQAAEAPIWAIICFGNSPTRRYPAGSSRPSTSIQARNTSFTRKGRNRSCTIACIIA